MDGTENAARRVLVYSPNTGGHRHIYSLRVIRYLLTNNVDIIFAYAGLQTGFSRVAVFEPHSSSYIDQFKDNPRVTMVKLPDSFALRKEPDMLRLLQEQHNIDATLIIDGDAIQWRLAGTLMPWRKHLLGKTFAMFILSEFMYRNAEMPLRCFTQWLAHLFLFKHLPILDGYIHMDENLVRTSESPRYFHIPEALCKDPPTTTNSRHQEFYKSATNSFERFLARHKDKEIILSFGDLEYRKGFDFLLKLVREDPSLILVRTGRTKAGFYLDWESVLNKEALLLDQRYFEINTYIEDTALVDRIFSSANYFLFPYHRFYRTSGALLQALYKQKPVLAPNIGLSGYRIETHQLGRTFQHASYPDFKSSFEKLRKDTCDYTTHITGYLKNLSDERFAKTFCCLLGDTPDANTTGIGVRGAVLPRQWTVPGVLLSLFGLRINKRIRVRKALQVMAAYIIAGYVRIRWRLLASIARLRKSRIIVFGAGRHTKWLEHTVGNISTSVAAVLDDLPDNSKLFWNMPPLRPEDWKYDKNDILVLSTDTCIAAMKSRCKEVFGQGARTINLYRGLPAGPYPK